MLEFLEKGAAHESAHHIVKTRWRQFGHHCLRERIIWSLEKTKHYIVCPARGSEFIETGILLSLTKTPKHYEICKDSNSKS
jgi:hypothetical protein